MHHEWLEQLTEQDRIDIVALMDDVALHETTMGYHEPLSPELAKALTDSMDEEIRHGSSHVLVFRDLDAGGRIVAMVTLTPSKLPARKHVIEMKRGTVGRDYRGRVLHQLFRAAMRRATELGCDRVILDVRADGPERLWRLLGFREYGRMEDYARVNGRTVAGIFMQATVAEVMSAVGVRATKTRVVRVAESVA